jgi:hypothetical protein
MDAKWAEDYGERFEIAGGQASCPEYRQLGRQMVAGLRFG